jgi:hypothetical protein
VELWVRGLWAGEVLNSRWMQHQMVICFFSCGVRRSFPTPPLSHQVSRRAPPIRAVPVVPHGRAPGGRRGDPSRTQPAPLRADRTEANLWIDVLVG